MPALFPKAKNLNDGEPKPKREPVPRGPLPRGVLIAVIACYISLFLMLLIVGILMFVTSS